MPGEQGSDDDRRLLDRPGFAQEFLRRNPLYRAHHQTIMRAGKGATQDQEVMARRWGLSFPMPTGRICRG
ncbi:hypothetical protein M2333_000178 [Sphingobium sp. B11D3B]|uniref:transcriptional regulator domain-containing protein n=1 Tax=Sphingobium sp. B11D3B TaxID=2940575 RepID=UPI0039B54FEA|nr:hypothetical protein [Sphingobium sp. B11D3B]